MSNETTVTKASWLPLITISLSMIMMYTTSFSINVLIAPIVTDLNWSVSGLQLMIVSASLIAGTLMVTAGRLGDKIGKKKVFLIGSIIYTVGLIIVILSPNSAIFSIAWAVIWPLGMVMVIPTSVALIMYSYDGPQRATAFGIYGAVLSLVSAIAPLVVGYLANIVGWRIALSLSPLFGVITIISTLSLPETSKDKTIKIDIVSVILSVIAFGLFLITTTMAGYYGWFVEKRPLLIGDTEISLFGLSIVPFLYLVSIILILVFFKRGSSLINKGEVPLLNASILKNGSFTVGMLVQALLYLMIAAVLFVLSVFVQSAAKFDSFSTALTTLPASAGVALFSFFTPGLGRKIAPKWIIVGGFLMTLLGVWLLGETIDVDMKPFSVFAGTLLFGSGCGLVMAQIATITMINVKPEENGEASGLSETLKEIIGQGFAIAFAGSLLFGFVYSFMVDGYEKAEKIDLTDQQKSEIILELEDTFQEITEVEEQEFISSLPENTKESYKYIVNDAATKGFQKTLWIMNIIIMICIVLAFFLPNRKIE